jgi:DnaK suppressor protein
MSKRDQKKRPAAKAVAARSARVTKTALRAKAKPAKKTAAGKTSYKTAKPAKPAKAVAKTKALTTKAAPAKRADVAKPIMSKPRVQSKVTARAKSSSIVLPPDYVPSENEPFMNERHRMYFRQKLLTWKEEIIRQTRETLVGLHDDSTQHADIADRATSETDRALELRSRDRQRKLVSKIDAALARIEDGSYGYCEETGEPIGLKRLDARPIATLSLEAQERHERRERVYRED